MPNDSSPGPIVPGPHTLAAAPEGARQEPVGVPTTGAVDSRLALSRDSILLGARLSRADVQVFRLAFHTMLATDIAAAAALLDRRSPENAQGPCAPNCEQTAWATCVMGELIQTKHRTPAIESWMRAMHLSQRIAARECGLPGPHNAPHAWALWRRGAAALMPKDDPAWLGLMAPLGLALLSGASLLFRYHHHAWAGFAAFYAGCAWSLAAWPWLRRVSR
jgi:hypothetical protein